MELRAAFASLYDEHAADLLTYFQSRTYSGEVAADLVAETFAEALATSDRYDADHGEHGAWLWGIARHLLARFQRTGAAEARARARLGMRTPAVHDDDLDRVEDAADAAALHHPRVALAELGPAAAEAVQARVVDGLQYDEVAHRCGCSVGAARVRVSRALSTLLDHLEGLRGDEVNR